MVDSSDRSVLGLLAAQRRVSPDALAVVDGSDQWSYAELHGAARSVTEALAGHGIGSGATVGVCLPRSKEAVAAMLGIWGAGAVYVPLDPDYPIARLNDVCERAGVGLLVGTPELLERLGSTVPRLDAADVAPQMPLGEVGAHPDMGAVPGSAAYILFTSGSSGRPKGVQVPHRALASMLRWLTSTLSPEELAVSTTSTSFSFDPSMIEVLGPLAVGGTVRVVPNALALSDADAGVTVLASTPSVISELLRARRLPPTLRLLMVGGEVLSPSLAAALLSESPHLRLFNCYGPTEGTVLATAHEVTLPVGDPVPIGRDLPGASVVLLDDGMHEVATGQLGEICIFGPQVADGYHGDPEGTAERFVEWTGGNGVPVRIYRTGDMGRRTGDGSIEFAGRRDRQLKFHGFRIEAGEVEVALCRHPKVNQAFVTTFRIDTHSVLIAYLTTSEPGVTSAELRVWLQDRLPHFMVPHHFVVLECFPTTVNGKVDEDALPPWQPDRGAGRPVPSGLDGIGDLGPVESIVAGLARQILGYDGPIQPEDDVLDDLGASSLALFRLLTAMEGRFSCRLSIGRILEDSSIAGLAALVGSETEAPAHLSINPDGTKPPIYLIHAYLGTALRYRRLGPLLSRDQPLVGVQVQEFGSRTRPTRTSVEQMAEEAVAQIRSRQPSGPYLLGGHSAGGLVAYEAARRLVGTGEEVPLVVVIDTPVARTRLHYLWAEAVLNWPDIAAASARERLDWIRGLIRRRIGRHQSDPGGDRVGTAITRSHQASNLAVKHHRSGTYDGAVAVLRTRQGVIMALGRGDLGWRRVTAGSVTVVGLPGLHNTIFEPPHVEVAGRQLDRILDGLDGAPPSPVAAPTGSDSLLVQPTL
ncbi:MAG: amino acid adenylation domain-containing protein [Acidimicrobiales bacterium]